MPYVDKFQTLREQAGLKKSAVAKKSGLSSDTISNIEKHKNCTRESCVSAINALNELYYAERGKNIEHDSVITDVSKF